ncbi:hypothetical protein EJ04DRAFT_397086, partial [Polyplosphaeria fusca]
LCEFNNAERLAYMILSHRWRDEEVSFADMMDPAGSKAQSKKGFAKIEASCHKALQLGYSYAWIDTCCIDKSSSAELSESINSMYEWYSQAGICLAHLDDVDVCVWFLRGWTLQELIAPQEINFYTREWTGIENKSTLKEELSRTTGICEKVLSDPTCLDEVSIAQKMSW